MASKEVAEQQPIVLTACSCFNECMEPDFIDLQYSRFLKKRWPMQTLAKRNFNPSEIFGINGKELINCKKFQASGRHDIQISYDDVSMSPMPKRRKRLTAAAYFAIVTGEKRRSWAKVDKAATAYVWKKTLIKTALGVPTLTKVVL